LIPLQERGEEITFTKLPDVVCKMYLKQLVSYIVSHLKEEMPECNVGTGLGA